MNKSESKYFATAARMDETFLELIEKKDFAYITVKEICEKAGVQHYRFHDLRHVNASAMLASGIPSTYSKQRMGHATDHMLKTVYYHTIKEEEVAYDAKIEQYLEDIMPEDQ